MNYRQGTTLVAPLIREPVPMESQRGHASSSQGSNNFSHTNEHKRREKLRAVLALMGSSSISSTRIHRRRKPSMSLDSNDDRLEDIAEYTTPYHSGGPHHLMDLNNRPGATVAATPSSTLTMANLHPDRLKKRRKSRKMSVSSDSTQASSLRGRRGAILTGKLLVKSFPEEQVADEEKTDLETKLLEEKRVGKFRVVAKLIVLLVRFGRTYILTENDAKMIRLFSAIDAAQAGDRYKIKSDLIFDVTTFRANKQYHISQDTKRILAKPSEDRTEKDITHVQVELQPLTFVKRYPVSMQRSMIQAAWYEEFTQGRVITRFGKRPQAFYLILGGSALVLEGDPDFSGRDAQAADKGDVFGHQAIGNRNTHKCSVISKEHIHLLCLSVEDYSRIFLAGGLQNFSDVDDGSFIKSLFIFDGWPINLLKDNPKMVKFNYYTQGTVIVEDSDRSEWIYIIKSGSCSVMKRLHQESHNAPIPAKKRRKAHVARASANHEQKLSQKLQELQRKRTKKLKGSYRPDAWKPNLLRVPVVTDPLDASSADEIETSPTTKKINVVSSSSSYDVDNRKMKATDGDVGVVVTSPSGHDVIKLNVPGVNASSTRNEQPKGKLLPHERISKFAKGPYLTHPKPVEAIEERITTMPTETKEPTGNLYSTAEHVERQEGPLKDAPSRMEESSGYTKQLQTRPRHRKQSLIVQIDVLEKGDVFGIMDVAFGKQLPHLSLTSNGVECIQISKRFYMKHVNESIIKAIQDKMRPYATEETLTKDLQEKLTWKDHRDSTMKDTARKFKRHKKLLADPRLPRPALLPSL